MSPEPLREGHRLRGIALYLAALFLFAGLDATAKYTARFVPSIEVSWVRFAGHCLLALAYLRPWRNTALYRPRYPLLQLLRAVLLCSSTVLNFLAVTHLQLAQTISISFASAFVVAGLAGPVLGEWIGLRRWVAIVIGFAGVLVVTRPGADGIDPVIFLSLASTACNSGYLLLTRYLAPHESAGSMLLFPALAGAILLAPAALPVAVVPSDPLVLILLASTGIYGAVGHFMLIEAHRMTPASALAPFVYSQLLWMVALGYFVFDDIPHQFTIIGAAIIIASGLYILYRERVRGGG